MLVACAFFSQSRTAAKAQTPCSLHANMPMHAGHEAPFVGKQGVTSTSKCCKPCCLRDMKADKPRHVCIDIMADEGTPVALVHQQTGQRMEGGMQPVSGNCHSFLLSCFMTCVTQHDAIPLCLGHPGRCTHADFRSGHPGRDDCRVQSVVVWRISCCSNVSTRGPCPDT